MKSSSPDGPTTKNKLFLGMLALVGVGFVLVSTHRYGVVVWPDSVYYLSTARNLNSGAGFISFDGKPLTLWPPLYPALLAFVSRIFGTDPLVIASIVNALIFGFIVYLAGTVLFRHLSSSPILAIQGTLAFLFAIPLFSIAVIAYTEPLFILLVLLSFISLGTYLSKVSITSLVLLSLSVSLALLTRYVGIILLPWAALFIFFFNHEALKKRIAHLALFTFIASLPMVIWLIRNYVVTHSLFGPRTWPVFSFSQILSFGSKNILDWYVPAAITRHLWILLLVCAVLVFLIGFSFKGSWQGLKVKPTHDNPTIIFSIACGSLIILYAGFVVISARINYVSVFEGRIWSPIFVPLTFLIFLFARVAGQQFGKFFTGRTMNSILIGAIAICLIYPMISTVSYAANLVAYGDGIGGAGWMNSETIQYIRNYPSECTYYSNGPDVIYFLVHVNAKWVPSRGGVMVDISSQKDIWPQETRACLVWFDNINRTTLFRPDELLPITNLEQVIKLGDGVIYIVTRK
jgi:Dolichyl-phosphate-mannose-protein mannosyltransferase